MLDSGNKSCPAGCPIVVFRNMPHHDKSMAKSMIMGEYAQELTYRLDVKTGQVTILCWWPLGRENVVNLLDEKQRKKAEDAVNEIAANGGKNHCWIATDMVSLSFTDTGSMLDNFIPDDHNMFLCNVPGRLPKELISVTWDLS